MILPFGGGKGGTMAARLARYAATTIQSQSPLVLEVDVARRVPLSQEALEERKAQEDAAAKLRVRFQTGSNWFKFGGRPQAGQSVESATRNPRNGA